MGKVDLSGLCEAGLLKFLRLEAKIERQEGKNVIFRQIETSVHQPYLDFLKLVRLSQPHNSILNRSHHNLETVPANPFSISQTNRTPLLSHLKNASPEPYTPFTMRLTAELIQTSLSYLNPLKERELDLRGAYQAEKSRYYTLLLRAQLISINEDCRSQNTRY